MSEEANPPKPDPNEVAAERAFQDYVEALAQDENVVPEDFSKGLNRLALALFNEKVEQHHNLLEQFRLRAEGVHVGAEIDGFRLIRQIGKGTTGVVWEAEQVALQRKVALKILHPYYSFSPSPEKVFKREATLLSSLNHHGLVRVFSMNCCSSGVCYMAMELVPSAVALSDYLQSLRDTEFLDVNHHKWCAEVFIQIAEAIHAAHQVGVVHLDIKPSNILLDDTLRPWVVDFGIARRLGRTSVPSSTASPAKIEGTLYYMSPEQSLGFLKKCPSLRSDVFSLGVTLYEALAGRKAFGGATASLISAQVLDQDPTPLSALIPAIPADLETICSKMMRKLPAQRYSSMNEVAEDLKRFLAGEPISARPSTSLEKARMWGRRHPVRASLLVMGLLLFAVTSTLLLKNVHANRELRQREQQLVQMVESLPAMLQRGDSQRGLTQRVALLEAMQQHRSALHQAQGARPGLRAQLLLLLGESYRSLEAWSESIEVFEAALETGVLPPHKRDEARIALAASYARVGIERGGAEGLRNNDNSEESIFYQEFPKGQFSFTEYQKAWDLLCSVSEANHPSLGEQEAFLYAWAVNRKGVIAIDCYHHQEALDYFAEVERTLEEIGQSHTWLGYLNVLDQSIAACTLGREPFALERAEVALEGYLQLFGPLHQEVPYCYLARFQALDALDRNEEATQALQAALSSAQMGAGKGSSIYNSIQQAMKDHMTKE